MSRDDGKPKKLTKTELNVLIKAIKILENTQPMTTDLPLAINTIIDIINDYNSSI